MNNDEAKFLLAAYRPDGRDAVDPIFREALAQAETDPTARQWFERARAIDGAVSAKLQAVVPPAGLRESILAGARAGQSRARPWSQHPLLMAAAIVVVLGALSLVLRQTIAPATDDLARLGLRDLAAAHDEHVGDPPGLDGLQMHLASLAQPLNESRLIDLEQLRRERCRTVRLAGREVFELCFRRDGRWFHLYAARRADFASDALAERARVSTQDGLVAASWADQENVYALVTSGSPETLRPLIRG